MRARGVAAVLCGLGLVVAAWPTTAHAQSLDCDHPSGVGCFEVTLAGGTGGSARVTGFAKSFGSDADRAWYVQLVEPGGASSFMLMYAGAGLPPTGEHIIVDFVANDAEPPAGMLVATGSVGPRPFVVSGFHSIGGTLFITSSTPRWVEGTFNFRAREATSGQAITVDGRFKAMNEGM